MRREGWGTVVCAATGPSFSAGQAEIIEAARASGACRVIAINDNYIRLPSADLLFAPDLMWWEYHRDKIRAAGFSGELWTVSDKAATRYGLARVKHKHEQGLTRLPDTINCGGNSGYMVLNLAYLLGSRRMILVGYDMQKTGGRAHWFGNHPGTRMSNHSPYPTFRKRFDTLAADLDRAGVEVVNATIDTALTSFPRGDLATCLM